MHADVAVFVGRRSQLATLDAALRGVRDGTSQVVVVSGAAGSGKTWLLRHFLAATATRDPVWVSGHELEQGLAFGVTDQLLAWRQLAPRRIGAGGDVLTAGADLLATLGDGQGDGPLVVVVDDAHWADQPSLDALTYALRRLRSDRVLAVVLTREPDELTGLVASGTASHVGLDGLTVTEIRALADRTGHGPLTPAAAARVRTHTDGNPLHVRALLDEAGVQGVAHQVAPLPAPRLLARGVRSRLSACSGTAERLVAATAVVGMEADLTLAADVAGLADPSRAVDEAVAAGLLETGTQDGTVRFAHPLVRAAVYHGLPVARRRTLHRAAAARTVGVDRLEHRIVAAIGRDGVLADDLAAAARREAAAGACSAAGSHLLAAAALAPEPGRRDRLVVAALEHLLEAGQLGEVCRRLGEVRDAVSTARRHLLEGRIALLSGRQGRAARLLEAAWQEAGVDEPDLAARAAVELGQLALLRADGDTAVVWGREALRAAAGDPALTASAHRIAVMGLAVAGRRSEGAAACPPTERGAVAAHEREVLFARGVLRFWGGEVDAAGDDLLEVVAPRDPGGPLWLRLSGLACLAKVEYLTGAWDDSLAHALLASSLVDDAGHAWLDSSVSATATLVLAARGDDAAAQAAAARAGRIARALGNATDRVHAAQAAAHLAFVRGDPMGIVEAYGAVADVLDSPGFDEPSVMGWAALHAEALADVGRVAEAERVSAAIAPVDDPGAILAVARSRAAVAAARQDWQAGVAVCEPLLVEHPPTVRPFARALLAERSARLWRRRGNPRRAAERYADARAGFLALGAAPFVARCDRGLAECGAAATSHRERLTPQERTVARLVAEGRTNREIAQALTLSTKTIEYHLGNVYTKLGLRSRTELTAVVVAGRAGFADPTPSIGPGVRGSTGSPR